MSRRSCVMCDLAATVNIMPVGKSLNKFGLLSKEIYHDLHKTNVNEGIKWRGLLHSINFQENKLARLALIELVRIENTRIAEELEKPEYRRQIGCICGQSSNAPHLKRSNSLSQIMGTSGHDTADIFSFGQSHFDFSAYGGYFPGQDSSGSDRDDHWKYMSLQPLKSPLLLPSKPRRRSRSLEILRPFTALDRETYIPRNTGETSSDSDAIDDEIETIFAGISSLNKDYEDEEDQIDLVKWDSFKDKPSKQSRDEISTDSLTRSTSRDSANFSANPSGFPSSSSVDSVVERVSLWETNNPVFDEAKDQSIGSPDLESTRTEQDITLEGRVSMFSSSLLSVSGKPHVLDGKQKFKDNKTKDYPLALEPLHSSIPKRTRNTTRPPDASVIDYRLLLVIALVVLFLLALVLFFLPERLVSVIVILVLLHLYTTRVRDVH